MIFCLVLLFVDTYVPTLSSASLLFQCHCSSFSIGVVPFKTAQCTMAKAGDKGTYVGAKLGDFGAGATQDEFPILCETCLGMLFAFARGAIGCVGEGLGSDDVVRDV